MKHSTRWGLVLSLIATALPVLAESDGPLTIADLPAYRTALAAKRTESAPPPAVTFRDLWDRPTAFAGRAVAIKGRVERVFHQGAVGDFPALAEVWLVGPSGDPFCLVFPDRSPQTTPKPGALIQAEATFLRRIRYAGGDVDRLAPLLVGPDAPRIEVDAAPAGPTPSGSPWDATFVVIVGAIIGLAVLRVHLRRPLPRRVDLDPPPQFETPPAP